LRTWATVIQPSSLSSMRFSKGVIPLSPCAVLRTKISREAVEKLLGRALSLEDVAAAWKAGEPRRRANAKFYAKRAAGVPIQGNA
jgi:hypothetical protein